MEFTQDEKDFLKSLLNQISIKANGSDALKTVELVQSILGKVNV